MWRTGRPMLPYSMMSIGVYCRRSPAERRGPAIGCSLADLIAEGHRNKTVSGRTVFHHVDDLAMDVPPSCDHEGRRRECIVEILASEEEHSERPDREAFPAADFRHECQACIDRPDVEIEFASVGRPRQILTSTARAAQSGTDVSRLAQATAANLQALRVLPRRMLLLSDRRRRRPDHVIRHAASGTL